MVSSMSPWSWAVSEDDRGTCLRRLFSPVHALIVPSPSPPSWLIWTGFLSSISIERYGRGTGRGGETGPAASICWRGGRGRRTGAWQRRRRRRETLGSHLSRDGGGEAERAGSCVFG